MRIFQIYYNNIYKIAAAGFDSKFEEFWEKYTFMNYWLKIKYNYTDNGYTKQQFICNYKKEIRL